MQRHARTQYMFQNTGIRTQRNRLRKLNNQTPSTMNWLNISTVIDEEGTNGFTRATGFTGSTTHFRRFNPFHTSGFYEIQKKN
jgi:hypothetical protein